MSDGTASLSVSGAIATLTIDHGARRNALSLPVRIALRAGLVAAQADPDIRAIILTGAGGHFSAGGDISSMSDTTPWSLRQRLAIVQDCVRLIIRGPQPVIAAVEGNAAGGGLALAAACDLVVAGESAQFSASFPKIGLMPDMGLAYTLPRRIGGGAARRIMLTAASLGAGEALRLGLADEVTPNGGALERALALAAGIAALAPTAVASTKRVLAAPVTDLDTALEMEAQAQGLLFATDDFREGIAAFLAKRKPEFRNR
ncbi:enoyl-CoA hydratase/isomerase family protein [Phreatobacter stygius]|uniref:Enoyl-CoA hydratase/isomerase family protein n=1 Tax=Phreatobacter stygius TaxID=1940610 RepID=A0A4D7AR32_9HYPH|nr:enoyl-CoA hydratase-related protein [Phreatobacter stygius]QCI63784.1 enoyl-CoA hydratase/isomerase family protein [Phreatobacter stygius]